MKKIIVIGCPGAGKSTFARALRDKTGIPLFYLDMLWHKPDRTNYTREEFDRALSEILETDKWIIDGNYSRTVEMRLRKCDTVFLLDYPLEICLEGAASRIGSKREDLPWTEEEFDPEFRQWIIDFGKDSLPKTYELIDKYKNGREIHIFRNRADADIYLDSLPQRKNPAAPT